MKKPGFIAGVKAFLSGFGLIRQAGVRRFVWIPLTINVTLFIGALWFGIVWIDDMVADISSQWQSHFTGWLSWLNTVIQWISWLAISIFVLAFLAVTFYTFTMVANLIGAPFNGLLAEKVEDHLSGVSTASNGNMMDMLKDIAGSIFSELRKLGYFALWAIPLLILFFIPVINVVAGALWFLFSAWMLALEYSDYPMGNHQLRFPHQRKTLKQNRLYALGFGTAAMTAMMIPIVNFFAMPVAVAGATRMWVDHWKDNTAALEKK